MKTKTKIPEFTKSKTIIILLFVLAAALSVLSIKLNISLKSTREEYATFRMLVTYALYDDMYTVSDLADSPESFDDWHAVSPFLATDQSIADLLGEEEVSVLSQRIQPLISSYEEKRIDSHEFLDEMEQIKQEIDFSYRSDPKTY